MEALRKVLLAPFGWLYGGITDVRHWLYRHRILHRVDYDLPVICVGNLSVGGTGKTPHVEYLIHLLKDQHRLAILSRGYRRKTKGFVAADETSTAASIGDEPAQIWMKYKDEIALAVGEERALAIPQILYDHPETDAIIMDDGFQHLAVRPSCSIILTDYARPFFDDMPLPAGMLRERRWHAKDAQAIIVTKCPDDLGANQMASYRQAIMKYTQAPVFFTGIKYETPRAVATATWDADRPTVLLSGIAKPKAFESYVANRMQVTKHFAFGDHHRYETSDLERIHQSVRTHQLQTQLLCTEKDAVKLMAFTKTENPLSDWLAASLFFLPISVYFINPHDESQFKDLITKHLIL